MCVRVRVCVRACVRACVCARSPSVDLLGRRLDVLLYVVHELGLLRDHSGEINEDLVQLKKPAFNLHHRRVTLVDLVDRVLNLQAKEGRRGREREKGREKGRGGKGEGERKGERGREKGREREREERGREAKKEHACMRACGRACVREVLFSRKPPCPHSLCVGLVEISKNFHPPALL